MTSSYVNRSAPNTGINRADRKVQDLKNKRTEDNRQMTNQANQQMQEMKRHINALSREDQYELKKLSNLSDTLSNAINVAVDQTQAHWNRQIEKGKLLYETRATDPAFNNLVKDVEDLESKELENNKKAHELSKKVPLETQKQEIIKLSYFERMGWNRAALNEAAQGFGDWRLNELATSTDLIPGTDVAVKDWSLVTGGYEQASQYLYNKYYLQHKGDFTAQYLTAKFIPTLSEIEKTQKQAHYQQKRKEFWVQVIEDQDQNLFSSLGSGNAEKIQEHLSATHTSQIQAYNMIGARDGGNKAWRAGVLENIKAYAKANPYASPKEIVQALKTWKVPGIADGKKSLFDLYGDEFSERSIKNIFKSAAKNQTQLDTQAEEATVKGFFNDLNETIQEKLENQEVEDDGSFFSKQEKKQLREDFSKLPGIKPADVADFDTKLNRTRKSDAAIWKIFETTAGEDRQLSEGELELLKDKYIISDSLVDQARKKGLIVDEPFLQGEGVLVAVTNAKGRLENALMNIDKRFQDRNFKLGTDQRSEIALKELTKTGIQTGIKDDPLNTPGLVMLARQLKEENDIDPNYTNVDALDDAATTLSANFLALQEDVKYANNRLFSVNKSGFDNINLSQETSFYKTVKRRNDLVSFIANAHNKGGNAAIYTNVPALTQDEWDIDPGTGGRPTLAFRLAAAADTSGTTDSWDMYNKWATQWNKDHPNLPPKKLVKKPKEAELLKKVMTNDQFWRLANNPGSKVLQSQMQRNANLPEEYRLKQLTTMSILQDMFYPFLGP